MASEQQLIEQLENLIAGIKDGTFVVADAKMSFTPQRIKDISTSPAVRIEETHTAELMVKWIGKAVNTPLINLYPSHYQSTPSNPS